MDQRQQLLVLTKTNSFIKEKQRWPTFTDSVFTRTENDYAWNEEHMSDLVTEISEIIPDVFSLSTPNTRNVTSAQLLQQYL